MTTENYVYKKEVDWSLLQEGLTLPFDNQVIFGQVMGRFLNRGESKDITLYLNGKSYKAQIRNVNFDPKFKRKKDTLQIRYSKNGELAKALQTYFSKSYQFIKTTREMREPGDRTMIRLPEECKEYLAIYTTEYDDSYVLMVNPFSVKKIKELDDNSPKKTDSKDPKTIAKLVVDGRYSISYMPEGIYAEIRDLVYSREPIWII